MCLFYDHSIIINDTWKIIANELAASQQETPDLQGVSSRHLLLLLHQLFRPDILLPQYPSTRTIAKEKMMSKNFV